MSLINQVLQDLDRRHAGASTTPSPSLRVAPPDQHDRPRVVAGAIGAGLVVVVVAAACALLWRQVDAHAASAPAPAAAAPQAAQPAPVVTGHAAWATPQLDAIDFGVASATPALVTMAAARDPREGAMAARATAAGAVEPVRDAVAAAPAPLQEARPAQVALASREAAPATVPLPVQLEKSTPPLAPADRAEADYRRGIELHESARTGDAEAAFSAALQHDGRHTAARRSLAVEWLGRGRTADAERILAEGLALNPQQPQLAVVLARIQAERHELPAAIDTLHASLRGGSAATAPDQAEALALMATLQQGAGQHREAIDAFSAALRQSPQNGAWWIGLGISLAAEGRGPSSREAFERARATGTLSPELLLYVEQRLRTTPG